MCFQHVTSAPWIKQIKTHVSFVIHAKWKQIEKETSIDSTVLLIKRYFANYILRPNHLLKISNPAIKLVKQKHSHFNMSIVRFLDETHSNSKVLKATVNWKGTNLQDPILWWQHGWASQTIEILSLYNPHTTFSLTYYLHYNIILLPLIIL